MRVGAVMESGQGSPIDAGGRKTFDHLNCSRLTFTRMGSRTPARHYQSCACPAMAADIQVNS